MPITSSVLNEHQDDAEAATAIAEVASSLLDLVEDDTFEQHCSSREDGTREGDH